MCSFVNGPPFSFSISIRLYIKSLYFIYMFLSIAVWMFWVQISKNVSLHYRTTKDSKVTNLRQYD